MKYGEFSKEKREASHVQSENDLRLVIFCFVFIINK